MNSHFILSFFKKNLLWIFIFTLWELILCALLFFNNIPSTEIWYTVILWGFFLIVSLSLHFLRYQKKYKNLVEQESNITVSLENLLPDTEGIDGEYQKLLSILYEELYHEKNQFHSRVKNMGEYYTMWVHQIKTPIAAMRLLLQEKSSTIDMTEELNELFEIEQYVEMALQYMRLDSDSTDFVFRKFSLDYIIKESIHKYARLFIRKRLKLNYTPILVEIVTDEKWLRFVIEQLLSNAIKYTPSGEISIYFHTKENHPCLTIEDTGIGIRAEDLPRVCERGYTGYNGHADKLSTGIGLYLCQEILKKLSLELELESQEGVGTKANIVFKKHEPPNHELLNL